VTNRFVFGQYKPRDSIGHRLDPRVKIFFAVCLMILSVFTTSIPFYTALIAGLLFLFFLSKISMNMVFHNIRPFVILVLITALYHILFSARDSAALISILGFRITEGGLNMAAGFSLRVLVFVGVAFFLSLTIMPTDLADSLVNWLKPLRKLKVPVNDIGLILFIAMRLIPVLAEEFDTIRKAQKVRGVDFSGSLTKKARKLVYLLIPVFQSALRRADDLALAIEARGYISDTERSSYRMFKLHAADWLFIILSIGSALILYYAIG
jgi:energy-coupling factor transport system permease protein